MATVEILIDKDPADYEVSVGGLAGTTTTTTTQSTTTVTTTSVTTMSSTTQSTTTGTLSVTSPPELLLHPPRMPQANPTLDKIAIMVNLSGSSPASPILPGLAGSVEIDMDDGEEIDSIRVTSDLGFSKSLGWSVLENGNATTSIVFGQDSDKSDSGVRNILEVTTNYGVFTRQFWVKNQPIAGGLYVDNQECQATESRISISEIGDISFSINILPNFADEFFQQHDFLKNRWANTLRSWGGAETAEVFLNDNLIISERNVALVNGYYWQGASSGQYTLKVRLRASRGSTYKVDLSGNLLIGESEGNDTE